MTDTAEGKRVLVCEDAGVTMLILRKNLVRMGYVVVGETTEGSVAIALAKQLCPDIVLMDVELADGVSGFEAARTILQDRSVPIVMMSGQDKESLSKEAFAAGAAGCVTKPMTAMQLGEAIEAACSGFGQIAKTEENFA